MAGIGGRSAGTLTGKPFPPLMGETLIEVGKGPFPKRFDHLARFSLTLIVIFGIIQLVRNCIRSAADLSAAFLFRRQEFPEPSCISHLESTLAKVYQNKQLYPSLE
jgi:hypothetical protein